MVKAYWWNHGQKTLDFNGTIKDCLKSKKIKFRRLKRNEYPELEKWKFTTSHNVTYIHSGTFDDGAVVILKLWYATMGDKAIVNVDGREFSNNYHRK